METYSPLTELAASLETLRSSPFLKADGYQYLITNPLQVAAEEARQSVIKSTEELNKSARDSCLEMEKMNQRIARDAITPLNEALAEITLQLNATLKDLSTIQMEAIKEDFSNKSLMAAVSEYHAKLKQNINKSTDDDKFTKITKDINCTLIVENQDVFSLVQDKTSEVTKNFVKSLSLKSEKAKIWTIIISYAGYFIDDPTLKKTYAMIVIILMLYIILFINEDD